MNPWYFLVLSVILFGVALLGMRHNDLTSFDMKKRIVEKDNAGKDVQQDIEALREYSFTHMNASRSFVLRGSYERAKTKARAENDNSIDGSVYEAAQAECDREGQRTTENAECVQQYVQQRLSDTDNSVNLPHKRRFSYTFHSPVWTTDIPGISIAASILSLLTGGVIYIKRRLQVLFQ